MKSVEFSARPRISFASALLLTSLTVIFTGCGSSESAGSTASGVVTVDGNPLESGLLQFYPQGEGRPAFAQIGDGGAFEVATTAGISGVAPGVYRVAVQYEAEEGNKLPFAEKFTIASESGIEVTVDESGNNVFAIELTGPEE